jgi:hypothetical protein
MRDVSTHRSLVHIPESLLVGVHQSPSALVRSIPFGLPDCSL